MNAVRAGAARRLLRVAPRDRTERRQRHDYFCSSGPGIDILLGRLKLLLHWGTRIRPWFSCGGRSPRGQAWMTGFTGSRRSDPSLITHRFKNCCSPSGRKQESEMRSSLYLGNHASATKVKKGRPSKRVGLFIFGCCRSPPCGRMYVRGCTDRGHGPLPQASKWRRQILPPLPKQK